jgi:hypothetical protein
MLASDPNQQVRIKVHTQVIVYRAANLVCQGDPGEVTRKLIIVDATEIEL